MSLVIDEHRQYLSDSIRIAAFDRAIQKSVRRGDRVLDLASGTGILGLLACRHGAGRVYSVDDGPIVGLARDLARVNGYADLLIPIRGLSTRTTLPEPVDVIVTDQIGRFGFDAGLVQYVADARERCLRAGGRIVPARVDLLVAGVEHPDGRAAIDFWNSGPAGFDLSPVRPLAMNTGYPVSPSREQLMTRPETAVAIDLHSDVNGPLRGHVELTVVREGALDGLLGGFVATLADDVTMTNLPDAGPRIKRSAAFLPFERSLRARTGDRLTVDLTILPDDLIVSWVVTCGGERYEHSTLRGMLLSSEDLAKTRPGYVPSLTPWGRARQSVLELCDGRRTLREIEDELKTRHVDLFHSRAEAAAFVNEVVGPYAAAPGKP